MKRGVLLLNLGTPNYPRFFSLYRYLTLFLSDERVITLPAWIRYPLVYGIIAPFRSRASAHAYKQVWHPKKGSPLRYHTESIVDKLQQYLGDGFDVSYAMRYGTPSIETQIRSLAKNCEHITLIPLFPQYASSSSGSALAKALEALAKEAAIPPISLITDYFDHPLYIEALTTAVKEQQPKTKADKWLMSFHGLPTNHMDAVCQKPCGDSATPCPPMQTYNRFCYRAQCYQSARKLAQALKLKDSDYQVAFQSRLGKTPWIKPYTDKTLETLCKDGIENIVVLCPSFPIDCLETLEEMGMQNKEAWQEMGGKSYTLLPSLNDHPKWIECLAKLVLDSHRPSREGANVS